MKRLIILALTLTVGLSACDVLDLEPKDRVTQFDYFKTANDLELFSNPFYNNLLDKEPFDEQSDLLVQNTLSAILFGGSHRTVPESGGGWSWTDLRRMNTLLEYADMCEDKEAVTKYTAVTRFFRAFFYFEKVKRFGDVPWYDIQLGSADELLYKPRDSRELILTKMLEDIDYAINSGGLTESAADPYHVNKWAALALKAQFCLYEGTWRKYHGLDGSEEWLRACVAASEELMGDSPYSLVSTAGEETTNYSKVFKSEEPQYTEVILANEFNATLNRFHDASWYYASGSYGQRNSGPKAFVNMYLNLDGTRFTDKDGYNKTQFKDEFAGRDYRLRQTFITPYYVKKVGGKETDEFAKVFPGLTTQLTYYRIIKWNTDDDANESNTSSANSLPVFRYAEILLNEAEAKAELGEMDQTVWNKTIRPLRERSGVSGAMPATADPYLASYYDGVTDKWILECRRERSIELYMENTRRNDLMRWRMGHKLTVEFAGIHIPELGKPFDMNGDGKNDLCFYSKSHPKSGSNQTGVSYVEVTAEEGDNVTTYSVNKDNCLVYILDREWADYKYLYPVPKNALDINPNLRPQNPGWDD